MSSRPLAATALALAVGLLAPGLPGALGLYAVAGIVPGLAAAAWLLPGASRTTRAIVGLALGPLVTTVALVGPFAAGGAPRLLVPALAIAAAVAWAIAPRRTGAPPTGAADLDVPFSRAAFAWAVALAVLVAIPPLAHEWARVKGDAWIHAGIARQILERGVPPEDPRWAGQILNYVWFFDFFVALLAGVRNGDPFPFMYMMNVADVFAFLGLAHLAAWTVWRDRRIATWAVAITAFGLNAGAWLLWPLRALQGLVGSVRGPEAVAQALRAPDLDSWRVIYELAAPFAHMVSILDKFAIGTALNYAWIQMLLTLWALLAWAGGGPRALLALGALGALGMLLFHGVVGLSAIPVLGLAFVAALALRRAVPALPPAGRLFAAGVALAVGGLAGLPYTRAISRGWDSARTGMAHSYIEPSSMMAWTLLTSCGLVFALAFAPARRLVRGRNGVGILLVLFTVGMTAFAAIVNLPENNEAKFAFQAFFPAALLAAAAGDGAWRAVRARLGAAGAVALLVALCGVPALLTTYGLTFDRDRKTAPQANVPAVERRFYRWLHDATPADAIVVDDRFRDLVMVLAGRQLYCGSPLGPERAGFPAAEARERHAVMADLYGAAPRFAEDAARLNRLGRPVFVLVRDADHASPAGARRLGQAPEWYRPVYDADGFVVYSVVPPSSPGGSR